MNRKIFNIEIAKFVPILVCFVAILIFATANASAANITESNISVSSNNSTTQSLATNAPASTTGQCLIVFDDGSSSQYSIAFQYMQTKGIVGTAYINGNTIDTPGAISLSHLQDMNAAGWIIASHSWDHTNLTTLTEQQIHDMLYQNMQFLINNGLPNGAYYLAFPYGDYNQSVLNVMGDLGIKTGRTTQPDFITNLNRQNMYELPIYGAGTYLITDNYIDNQNYIQYAINTNSTIIILFHQIVDTLPPNPTDQITNTDFQTLIDYIANSGINCITINDLYQESATANPWVKIYRDGLQVGGDFTNIQTAYSATRPGDTIKLKNGATYDLNGLSIFRDLTFSVDNGTATINGTNTQTIFTINPGVTVTLQNLIMENGAGSSNGAGGTIGGAINNAGNLTVENCTFKNNNATYGGAIYNIGNLTENKNVFQNNTASFGGAIYNYGGTVTESQNTFTNNTASNNGGAIYNNNNGAKIGTISETQNTFTNNTATTNNGNTFGGAIFNQGNLTENKNVFQNNTASFGGAIYNYGGTVTESQNTFTNNIANIGGGALYNNGGNSTINFSRIIGNNKTDIYNNGGSVDATYNWWGSNDSPSSRVYGGVNFSPYMILNLTTSKTVVGNGEKISVYADLTKDSSSVYHNPSNGHIPDGIPVIFTTTLGTITSPVSTVNGVAEATLTGGNTAGTADIYAFLDDEIVNTSVTTEVTPIDTINPTIISTSPANGSTNVSASKTITITFSEAIVKSSNFWVELLDSTGKAINYTSSITGGNILSIDPISNLAESKYKLILHTGCVTDLAGNPLAVKSIYFSVGTSPIISSSSPSNGAIRVPRSKTITITFNEAILKSSNFWVELVNSKGTAINYTSWITSGKILVIDPTANLAANTKYYIKIHTGCVTDLAGNPVAAKTITFTTGST